jgi:hypothetical protein
MEIKILISDGPAGGEGATQTSGLTFGQATPSGAMTPAIGALGRSAAVTGSVVQPPDYLARAAAAIGAHNGGPAPMLSGLTSGAPGEPVQFTSASIAAPAMAAVGAADQSAGAAPGAERAAPTVVEEEEEGDEEE